MILLIKFFGQIRLKIDLAGGLSDMKKISVNLSIELEAGAQEICNEKQWSMTAVINDALQLYLRHYNRKKLAAKIVSQQLSEA